MYDESYSEGYNYTDDHVLRRNILIRTVSVKFINLLLGCLFACLLICLLVCSLTPPKRLNTKYEVGFPWSKDGFIHKKIQSLPRNGKRAHELTRL